MDGACLRAIGAPDRGHLAYLDRHRLGAIPLDRAARAISRHIRPDIPPWRRSRCIDILVRVQPYMVAPLVIGLMGGDRAFWMVAITLNLAMFAISAMICHRELYLRRPQRLAPDRILPLDLGRRRARRHRDGITGAGDFPGCVGISDPDRAGVALPAGRFRRRREAVAARRRHDRGGRRCCSSFRACLQGDVAAGSGTVLDASRSWSWRRSSCCRRRIRRG